MKQIQTQKPKARLSLKKAELIVDVKMSVKEATLILMKEQGIDASLLERVAIQAFLTVNIIPRKLNFIMEAGQKLLLIPKVKGG